MARRSSQSDTSRFFGSVGPSTLGLSAFGTSLLVPLLLIAIIAGSALAIAACIAMILLLVWLTLRALRVGYRLDGRVLTSVHASRRATSHEVDLGRVQRTGRQRRDTLELKLRDDGDSGSGAGDAAIAKLQMSHISMHSAARLRSVMENEFGIDCSTWGVTGPERARRDRAAQPPRDTR